MMAPIAAGMAAAAPAAGGMGAMAGLGAGMGQFAGGFMGSPMGADPSMPAMFGKFMSENPIGYSDGKSSFFIGGSGSGGSDQEEFSKMLKDIMQSQQDGSEGISGPTQAPRTVVNQAGTWTPGPGVGIKDFTSGGDMFSMQQPFQGFQPQQQPPPIQGGMGMGGGRGMPQMGFGMQQPGGA